MRITEGQHVIYALGGANCLIFGRVTKVKSNNLIDLEIRSNDRLNLTVVNDPHRLHIIPNSETPAAQRAIGSDDVKKLLEALEMALDVGATVATAAAPGLAGGAALMSGLAAIGGTAVGGILVATSLPAALAGNTLRKIIKRHENNTDSNDAVAVGMITGGVCGGVTVVGSVAAAGTVGGLSAAGITSGLAGLGGGALAAGGWGMAGGLVVCTGIFTVPILSCGVLAWALVADDNEARSQRQYDAFCQRWHNQGYRGPS
ncbi:hypothetical protein TWF506_003638 [Arthrobotrys conoides]|uniref:Uncharacterized protein n=1 Tax=Arthrobotrys conoides TaxID=74498 RepID=A0AAN8MXW0_9PEZI